MMHMLSLPLSTAFSPKTSNSRVKSSAIPILLQRHLSLVELCQYTSEFRQLHSGLIKIGLIHHPLAFTRLLCYSSISPFTDMAYPELLFAQDTNPNTFSYNVIIRGYSCKEQPFNALILFDEMLQQNLCPNHLTFPFVLKACALLGKDKEGEMIHGLVVKLGLSDDMFVVSSLVSMYSDCGLVELGYRAFEKASKRDVVMVNTMVRGLVDAGCIEEARLLFDGMQEKSLISWNCLIDGYAKVGLVEDARRLFDEAREKDVISWNSMIGGYVSLGCLEDGRRLFDHMSKEMKDLITFNLMIDGYGKRGEYQKVLKIFSEMQEAGIEPNKFSLVSVLKACAHMVSLSEGEWIQAYIYKNCIEVDAVLGTAMIDMFAKCGEIERALSVFANMEDRDVGAWNAVIYNLGIHGYAEKAMDIYSSMLNSSSIPDDVTYLSVLNACRHSGLVEEGKRYFSQITEVHKMRPTAEHYGCMVDLLARAGLLDDARDLLEASGLKASITSIPMWGSLLGASSRAGNVEMGEYAAQHLLELDPSDTSCYVILANIYSSAGMHEQANQTRQKMKSNDVNKDPGYSLIEINGTVHEFKVSSNSLE